MNMKIPVILLLTSFGLMTVGAMVGGYLESSGIVTRERLGPRGIAMIMMTYFALFCLAAFAVVPFAVRVFIVGQVKIGNGELSIIKWLQAHEQTVVYCFWGIFAAGLAIALVLAKDQILSELR